MSSGNQSGLDAAAGCAAALSACVILAEGLAERRRKSLLPESPAGLESLYQQSQRCLFRLLLCQFAEARGLPPQAAADGFFLDSNRADPSTRSLARASELLWEAPGSMHAGSAPVRLLGTIYESLLESRLVREGKQLVLIADRTSRKASGSFYTPEPIVRFIVEHAVGPLLEDAWSGRSTEDSRRLYDSLTSAASPPVRIMDPAMGSGHFLVEALHFVTRRLDGSLRRGGVELDTVQVRRAVAQHCLFGVDRDPVAVELARASLWLESHGDEAVLAALQRNLKCGDSLQGAPFSGLAEHDRPPSCESCGTRVERQPNPARSIARPAFAMNHPDFDWHSQFPGIAAGFDAVIGNPPYSGHLGDAELKDLANHFSACRQRPNPAIAFLERGLQLLRPGGRLGMVVPKSIQYVESWSAARRLLAESHRLLHVADVSQAFDSVLLEQTVCIASRQPPQRGYLAATLQPGNRFTRTRIAKSVVQALGCLPADVDRRSLKLLQQILKSGPLLGEIAVTAQALGYQSRLNQSVSGDHLPIWRGKQVRPLRLDAPADFIDRHYLTGKGSDQLTPKCQAMLQPKVVSQNIVAHVARPKPRVWIISAADHAGGLCLNTISTTFVRDERFPIDYIAAVLNSTLAAWFYTEFVFCRAIRTMHFDQFYAGKLPIATIGGERHARFERLPSELGTAPRGLRQRAIDEAVFDAYGIDAASRSFLYEYCYGTSDIEGEWRGKSRSRS